MASGDSLRLVFAGTPGFAATALAHMFKQGHRPVAVLTQPDRRAGRGRQLAASEVKQLALEHDIPVLQPASFSDESARSELAALQPDLMIVVAYGLLLPREILELPTHGCWNIHASLLPRWRGAAPIQRAIEAGDTSSGVCIMQMDEGLDTGPVLLRAETAIAATETGGSLHDRLAGMGSEALVQCLEQLAAGQPPTASPQDSEGVTYARKLSKAEAAIDWSEPAPQLARRIRAFNPWPVCWCDIGGERTRIWSASVIEASAGPGVVLAASDQGIDVACGEGALRLEELQPAGSRRMGAGDFLRSRTLPESLADPV